jgi:HK97 family phage major capsid protein
MDEELKTTSIEIKEVTDDTVTVAGYGIVFGGKDLEGDTFMPDTDLDMEYVPVKRVYYDHTLEEVKHSLGTVIKAAADEIGVWVEAQLDRHKDYVDAVTELIKKGVIGWSSGSAGHLVSREKGIIKKWPVIEFSLTPTPAEPRTLGVELRTLLAENGIELPEPSEALVAGEAEKAVPDADNPTIMESDAMDENKADTTLSADKVEEIVAKALEADRAALKANAEAEAKAQEEFQKAVDEGVKSALDSIPAWKGGFSTPKVTELGMADDDVKSFEYWIKTGDEGAVKAALQGQTDTEGGYAVPDDFYNQVVAKRADMSVARRAGAISYPTNLDRVLIPTEGTSMSKFAITAEEGAIDENEPTFGQVILPVYRETKLVKASVEWLADAQAGAATTFLAGAFGRAEAAWENHYFVSTGTAGTGEPTSALVSSGLGVTAAGTNAITGPEVVSLVYSVPDYYRMGASMVMAGATEGALRGLQANPFSFQATPAGGIQGGIEGLPVFNDATMPAMTTGLKPILVGNFRDYFVIVERANLVVQRLVELYAGNGQVGLLGTFRRGGGVTQAGAFKHLIMA